MFKSTVIHFMFKNIKIKKKTFSKMSEMEMQLNVDKTRVERKAMLHADIVAIFYVYRRANCSFIKFIQNIFI